MKAGNFDMNSSTSGIATFRDAGLVVRGIAMLIVVAFGGLVTSPAVAATRAEIERQERTAIPEQSESAKLNAALLETREALRALAGKPDAANRVAALAERKAAREALKDLRQQLRELDKAAREDFRDIEKHLKAKNLPDVILERHHNAVAQYEREADALLADLAALETADDTEAAQRAAKAFERLEKQQLQRSHKPFDPDKMPFGRPDGEVREPAISEEEFSALGFEPQPEFLAASMALASSVGFGADDPANPVYLAANPDVQITPAIQQLAEELNNNPVKIYNWIRNNIEFLPTYGSIQGSQLTLDNRKGNAFDTASLTIALLRAAGIPARYVYGTVELPADKVMNWVGGVTNPMAAGNLMGQGGIPHTALAQGGEIKAFRFEHVWVEAWIDFYPSRGAVNREGDSWVPMDASFKQYEYAEGIDVQQEVPFDADGFAQDVLETAVVNEAEGWVQGIDQTLIQQRMEEYRSQVETFIDAHDSDSTVGEVIGAKTIIEENHTILAGSLFGKISAIGARYGELPDSRRLKFQYVLHDNYGFELARFQKSAVELAGKRLALSFRPATQADEDLIVSYLPDVPEGEGVDQSDLPSELPGYLINLTAEFTVDGEVAETGPIVTMGTEIRGQLGYYFPNKGWNLRPKTVVAGEYQAVGLDLAGIAPSQLEGLKADLETVRAKLENENPEGLTRHSLTGNLLQTGVLSYFALNDVQDVVDARNIGVATYRLASFGTFGTYLEPKYYFGLPRSVGVSGTLMDVDYLFTQVVDKENDAMGAANFMRYAGPRTSALEHLIPEDLFSTEENPLRGISAIKAIAIAQAEGQRLHFITARNIETALAAVQADAATEDEIRNAVLAGNEVTTHEHVINHNGWSGHGYIIVDPDNGSSAYKISGGQNGGYLPEEGLLLWMNFGAIIAPLLFLSALGPIGIVVILLVLWSFSGHLDKLTEISKIQDPKKRIDALNKLLFVNFLSALVRFGFLKKLLGDGGKGEAWALWVFTEAVLKGAEEFFIP